MKVLLRLILVASLAWGCSKDDPNQESFFMGTWELIGVRSGNEPEIQFQAAQSVEHGTFEFSRRKDKAKRGSYNYKFTENNGTLQEHQGSFIWWMRDYDAEKRYIQVNMDEFGQKQFGVGDLDFGTLPEVEVINNNQILLRVRLVLSSNRPHKGYEFELRRK